MANLAQAFAGGFESGQAIGDTIVADRDFKQAQAESGPGADLFTTYQKAGQMAMQSGNTRVADKFLKQANEYKGDALKQHISELKVHQGEVEALYQDLQGSKTKDDLLGRVNKAAASGRLSEAEKLEYSGAINKLTDEQVPAFIEQAGKKTLDYKQQLDVQSKIVNDAFEHDIKTRTLNNQIERTRLLANKAAGGSGSGNKEAKADAKHSQTRIDKADDELRAEKARIRKLDPKKFDEKAKAKLIADAEIDHEEAVAAAQPKEKSKETPTKSDVSSVTPQDKDKLLSLDKEGKLTKGQKEEFDSHYGKGAADKLLGGTKSSSKPGAGQKTHDGYPARENADGSYSTEVSITVTNPKLNNGKPTNIPSLWKGKEVDEDTAVRNALATGKSYKSFNSINEAVSAAKARSEAGGAGADNKPETKKELTDEEQLSEDLAKATGVQERNAIRNDYNIRQERKAKQAKQKAIAAKGKEKTEAAIAKAQKKGLVLSGMSGTQLKFVDPKTGKEVLESEL